MIRVSSLSRDYTIAKRRHFWSRKEIQTVHAVKDLSFTIADGEKVGLVGLNGSGKTTSIKMLTGILTPSAGTVEVNGFVPQKRERAFLSQIGVAMGQRSSLFFDIPLRESLEYYKEVYRISDRDYAERMDDFDHIMEIKPLLDTPVRKLSFGQRMKAELVCAILHLPQVLFLDEPTIGLDVVVKDRIFQFLNLMNQKYHCTILLTTHELENIEKFCRRILVLRKGTLIYDGEVSSFCAMSQYRKFCIPAELYRQMGCAFDSAVETERGMEFLLDTSTTDCKALIERLMSSNFTVTSPSLEDVIKFMEKDDYEAV